MTGLVLFILRIAIAIVLYGFLAWGLFTLWQDLRRTQATAQRFPVLSLTWKIDNQEFQHQARTSQIILGRDPGCDFSLDDPALSSRHARFSFRNGQWWLEDLRSKNGTFLNGEPVKGPVILAHGDELRCGSVLFSLTIAQ